MRLPTLFPHRSHIKAKDWRGFMKRNPNKLFKDYLIRRGSHQKNGDQRENLYLGKEKAAMKCKQCKGEIIKIPELWPSGIPHDPYAKCQGCRKQFTWQEYRSLQADKLIEMVMEEERKK